MEGEDPPPSKRAKSQLRKLRHDPSAVSVNPSLPNESVSAEDGTEGLLAPLMNFDLLTGDAVNLLPLQSTSAQLDSILNVAEQQGQPGVLENPVSAVKTVEPLAQAEAVSPFASFGAEPTQEDLNKFTERPGQPGVFGNPVLVATTVEPLAEPETVREEPTQGDLINFPEQPEQDGVIENTLLAITTAPPAEAAAVEEEQSFSGQQPEQFTPPFTLLKHLVQKIIPEQKEKECGMDIGAFTSIDNSSSDDNDNSTPSANEFPEFAEPASEDISNLPLFKDSTLSVHDCMVCILSYAQSAHLSGASTVELLGLLEILLPQPNNLPKTAHMFKKYFQNDKNELQTQFFCSNCWRTVSPQIICTACSAPNRKINYFVYCSLEEQLQRLYSRPGFCDKLKYKSTRKKQNNENIEDIYDGTVYKNAEKGILSHDKNISLTWYSDGVSIYECSTYSLWICMYIINELPPEDRHKIENVLISGLWGGDGKPHPNIFLAPMYPDIIKLKDGIKVTPYGSDVAVDVCGVLVCGTCDVPAKACFMNMKGHSGYFSCSKCLIKGEKSDRTGQVMVFPHQDVLDLRNDENYFQSVVQGSNSKDGHMGIFGPSILFYMWHGSFIDGMTVDIMHSAYMGVTKQLLRAWFDPKFKGQPFSMIEHIGKINERIALLNLPHFVQRCLLEVDTTLSFWKASLCRNFLLYIVVILMNGIMPKKYFDNLVMLVNGLSLLNSSSISTSDRDKADKLLAQFCKDFQTLYGLRHMSYNIHLLRHLRQCVEECGPLFLNSCFRFEHLNGLLAALVHGTRHAIKQIGSRLSLVTDLPLLIDSVSNESAKLYCNNLVRRSKNFKLGTCISKSVHVVGDFYVISQHSDSAKELTEALYGKPTLLQYFHRLYKHSQLFVCHEYTKGSRISYMCKYERLNEMLHGRILTFVSCSSQYFALIEKSICVATELGRYSELLASPDRDLIPVHKLVCVSFCLEIEGRQYVIDPLNSFELE